MGATASAVRIRHDLHTRLINARKRTDELFRIVREDSIYDRPIAERHRIIFTLGTWKPSIGICWRSVH